MKRLIYLFVIPFVLTSCFSNVHFQDSKDINQNSWDKGDTIQFDFVISDTSSFYNIYYDFRYNYDFPYENLYLSYTLLDTTGTEIEKNLQWLNLFHPQTGEAFGSGISSTFDYRIMGIPHVRFKKPTTYILKINQEMRKETLPGIVSVGIRVEKSTSK